MSNLIEQKNYLEYKKMRLWQAFFKGKTNKGMLKDINHITEEVKKINDLLRGNK